MMMAVVWDPAVLSECDLELHRAGRRTIYPPKIRMQADSTTFDQFVYDHESAQKAVNHANLIRPLTHPIQSNTIMQCYPHKNSQTAAHTELRPFCSVNLAQVLLIYYYSTKVSAALLLFFSTQLSPILHHPIIIISTTILYLFDCSLCSRLFLSSLFYFPSPCSK